MAELNWRDAITRVLQEADEPLHYRDITAAILEQGLRSPGGATPDATVGAELSSSIKHEGSDSPYERVAKGVYRLRPHAGDGHVAVEAAGAEEDAEEVLDGLVTSFGMYWSRDRTLWSPPQILGQLQPQSTPVDFAQQHGVYLLHDRREVVYAGRATQQGLGPRIGQHTVDRLNGRWDRYSWFGVHPVNDDGTLDLRPRDSFSLDGLIEVMEALLIEGLEPRQNRKRGDGFKAFEFIQSENPELERRRREALREDLKRSL